MNSPKPNIRQTVPFFRVSDMERSLRFYMEGLGFEMLYKWDLHGKIEWCWVQRGAGALMLQEFKQEDALAKTSPGKLGEGISIYFICEDALELYYEFSSHGIVMNEPFVGNNCWDVGLTDPDGYHLHFESPTDVPEETKYSEWEKGNIK